MPIGLHPPSPERRGRRRGIESSECVCGNALFKRAAADQDFLDTLEAHLKGTRGMALFRAWGLIDYGRSLLRVAAISFGLAAIYGVIYIIFPYILDYKDSANTWFTPYYSRSSPIRRWASVMCGRRPSRVKSSSAARLFSATRRSVCSFPSSRKASLAAAESLQLVLVVGSDVPTSDGVRVGRW